MIKILVIVGVSGVVVLGAVSLVILLLVRRNRAKHEGSGEPTTLSPERLTL